MTVVVSVFRVLASCTSIFMVLSPVPSIVQILRDKSTGVGSIVPLVAMLTNGHFMYVLLPSNCDIPIVRTTVRLVATCSMLYGYLTRQYFPIFSTFVASDVLALTYISIFYLYTHERPKAHRVFLLFGTPISLVTLYAILGAYGLTGQSRYAVGQTVGHITIASAASFYSSPMERIGLVLKHRSAVFLNIHMLCAATCNNAVWLVFGYLTQQWVIFAPNVFFCAMGCFQTALYAVFHPSTHPYDGPIPGLTPHEQVDVEVGDLTLASRDSFAKSKAPSPAFVALASPVSAGRG